MTRSIIFTALAAAILAAAGAPAATAAEKNTVKASAAWVGQGRIFQTGVNEAMFLGAWGGVLYVESEEGKLDADRLRRYRKLQSEDRRNTESMAERRARDRSTGRLYKSILADKQREKGGD